MGVPLSVLDLATIGHDETPGDSLRASIDLAQRAERWGYRRIWYAEHHNMSRIASSATSVIIGHIAANTSSIRLGAGGIMLPNHAPLTIAEQFGTLETLHPGRIDLGLGRAPGSDQNTAKALRRDPKAAETFPQDVQELQGYLGEKSLVQGVQAVPGKGTGVPLYILGSSLFGAKLAAALGLPYSFASHFAPNALEDAVSVYRREFTPSEQLSEPYVIAGVNIVASDTTEQAREQLQAAKRSRLRMLTGRNLTREEADSALDSPAGQQAQQMLTYSAVGTADEVKNYLDGFAEHARADELMVTSLAPERDAWLRSFELLAEVTGMVDVAAQH
ncbi:luciferase family oxidoreductase group 1 [Actinopolyspora lacussalsi]|uniref:Luciferase family oxidoreductase, group 1 n=1 Tax=Actinopolyspora alba TaxID=673379 RepID=A0A1I1ZM99_9ACTN|nr:LLM class flavin-dependent oxidoreductase [Actinopolyspora alba]MDP9641290.1 luciferase family oxidoreductase group 1 [Actinopolyspora lacussalsi]SFE32826.1 luciferase family oxidoreductase, group 1 [Actinopolyspora alba]